MFGLIIQLICIVFLSLILGCPGQKSAPSELIQPQLQNEHQKKINFNSDQPIKLDQKKMDILKFSGSVEVEIFKILDARFKNTNKIPSQINILAQLIEPDPKKDIFFDCLKIEIQKNQNGPFQSYSFFKKCEKIPRQIATFVQLNENQFKLSFNQMYWKAVIGDSALMNLKDKVCDIFIKNQVVQKLNCENTLITVDSSEQLEEIKLHHYYFDREDKNQIKVRGGRFKNMLEVSQIEISVPDQGRIRMLEKEIEVKDDFAQPIDEKKEKSR